MMKHKVGDKVKIRSDLKRGQKYGTYYTIAKMRALGGKIARITGVNEMFGTYQIDLECRNHWTDEMFEEEVQGMKYKVGDKVRVRKDLQVPDYFGKTASNSMIAHAGREVTIRSFYGNRFEQYYTIEEDYGEYKWMEEMFEEDKEKMNDNDSIRILANGNQVVAIHMETGKKGVARCHPDDDFDFYIGAKIALERLEDAEKPYGWLKLGGVYFIPNITDERLYQLCVYGAHEIDKRHMKHGIVFQTKEEAIACARKMLEVVKQEGWQ